MLNKDKIKLLEEEIKYLKTLDGNDFYKPLKNCIRESKVKLPSLKKVEEIEGSPVKKIYFFFAPLVDLPGGVTFEIKIISDCSCIYLNDLGDSLSKNIDKLYELFNIPKGEEGYWLDDKLYTLKLCDELRNKRISTKFLLSFFDEENIEYLRNNAARLGLGIEYNDYSIDRLIHLAELDRFIAPYENHDR